MVCLREEVGLFLVDNRFFCLFGRKILNGLGIKGGLGLNLDFLCCSVSCSNLLNYYPHYHYYDLPRSSYRDVEYANSHRKSNDSSLQH